MFPPPLYSSHIPPALGRPLKQNEIFDVLDSKFVNVFPENEFNKFLDEVEVETYLHTLQQCPPSLKLISDREGDCPHSVIPW